MGFIGSIAKSIGGALTGAIGGFMGGGGPLGAIIGGVSGFVKSGGISAITSTISKFAGMAGNVLGKLGQAGLSALRRPPFQFGRIAMPWRPPMQPPTMPGAGGGAAAAKGGSLQERLVALMSKLEKDMEGAISKAEKQGDNLKQAGLAKLQSELGNISSMMKMVTGMLQSVNDTLKGLAQLRA
jgi:hypothetical protein